jgi:hypothetical protein
MNLAELNQVPRIHKLRGSDISTNEPGRAGFGPLEDVLSRRSSATKKIGDAGTCRNFWRGMRLGGSPSTVQAVVQRNEILESDCLCPNVYRITQTLQ